MNLSHLKYIIEVEKTRSISKAAENLYMGQPNLSRAIKELEKILGITLFKRTSKGISPTPQGEEFLQYAKKIISQVDEVKALYSKGKSDKQQFSISVPRASYIADAFTQFAKTIDTTKPAEIFYKETNSMRAISNILQADYKLAIIRYQKIFEPYFKTMLYEKGLTSELVREFSYLVLMDKNHPLAKQKKIEPADLSKYIEIAHADPYVPSLPQIDVKKAELSEFVDKHIFVFERGSQFDLLSNVPGTFMWASPLPARMLKQYGLVQKPCLVNKKTYKDVLVYRKNYRFTDLDNKFITQLNKAKSTF
ncbi:DNA-binding transcriptional LysR family regulator [Elusimicrobium simillimum]|uniref:LysR family transcriptional regulator n=1 Tax=Elusimicrobium simillimum TaxID=3143438 RepID=UPI003C705E61